MTRREQLQDRYEDARFALLMDELGAAEERQAQRESHRLNADGAAEVPEDLDRRCTQTIRREFAKRRLRAVGRFAGQALKRVALAAGIAAILFTTAFALSETVRVNTMNLLVQVFETNTEFRFSGASEQVAPQLDVGWVPDGYTLTDQGNDEISIWSEYRNAHNQTLSITYWKTDELVVGIDTENAEVEHIQVQGAQAMLVKKDNRVQLVWPTKDNSMFVDMIGYDISREDILHIADELSY